MRRAKNCQQTEFGDFQTPLPLAVAVCRRLAADGLHPVTVVEPTCGEGTFLQAAVDVFPQLRYVVGRDCNSQYVATAESRLSHVQRELQRDIATGDFFQQDWAQLLQSLPRPLLILGNPPWVTNSTLGSLASRNVPPKSNFLQHRGIEAKTGKANFDISQWMIAHLLGGLVGQEAHLAMLCKTAVARNVLRQAWQEKWPIGDCSLRAIDARQHFSAAVDASLFTCRVAPTVASDSCRVYSSLQGKAPDSTLGILEGRLVANRETLKRHMRLLARPPRPSWRSGIKHDCRLVMQLERTDQGLFNGLGQRVEIEKEYVYPLRPAKDVYQGRETPSTRFVVVPQRHTGEDTRQIETAAPRTWKYLMQHRERLAARKSSIYRGRPPFSIFGVGSYSFAPWKVAVSALHKALQFRVVGPQHGRPVMLDDTTYFLSFATQDQADAAAAALASPAVQQFLSGWIFWDAKRPITAEVLNRLDLGTALRAGAGTFAALDAGAPGPSRGDSA